MDYTEYLKIDDLLSLQIPQSSPAEHDETLFIIIHQTYELWFKQVMHEISKLQSDLENDNIDGALHTLKRLRNILKVLVSQVDILETMTPCSFASFRDRLDTASGFQSVQYRIFEFTLGYKREAMINYHPEGRQKQLREILNSHSLYHHFYLFLKARGYEVPSELIDRDPKLMTVESQELSELLVGLYRDKADIRMLIESMTDVDEGLMEWRYRHVMLVMRAIGDKKGTGGSLGVDFLKQSLFRPAFPDLWTIRSML